MGRVLLAQFMSIQSKVHANRLLSYAIRALQGKEFTATVETKIYYGLLVKENFEASGFWWQAKILDSWIHRLQGGEFTARRADPRRDERGEAS
jgi:hypothetical protein